MNWRALSRLLFVPVGLCLTAWPLISSRVNPVTEGDATLMIVVSLAVYAALWGLAVRGHSLRVHWLFTASFGYIFCFLGVTWWAQLANEVLDRDPGTTIAIPLHTVRASGSRDVRYFAQVGPPSDVQELEVPRSVYDQSLIRSGSGPRNLTYVRHAGALGAPWLDQFQISEGR